MAERIRRALETASRRLAKRVRVEDLKSSQLTAKEIINNQYNSIFLGALKNGYAYLSHKPRDSWPVDDYSLALYTENQFCVEVDGTDYQSLLPKRSQPFSRAFRPSGAVQHTRLQVGIIFDRWIGNYYHWMVFCVPKLILLRELFGVERFYMPSDLYQIPAFVWETLELLSLPEEALIPICSGIHQAAELCFVHGAGPSPFTCQLTRRRLPSTPWRCHPVENKVFLLRKSHTHARRTLVNEGEVLRLCAQEGIQPIDPGAMTLKDQIAMFQEVDVMLAVHGAGLTNMLWMPSGSKVIEISTGLQPHYKALAEHLGVSWMSLRARKADPKTTGHNGEFIINVTALKELFEVQRQTSD